MQGGVYEIEVTHHIAHPDGKQELNPASKQKFNVNAPRFTLPPGIVHSTYPPQGLGDHNNVLPHIVFNDPHLPWEQEGSPKQDRADAEAENEPGGEPPRNKIPWVALLTFTEDELKLDPRELKKRSDTGLFPDVVKIPSKSVPPPIDREQDKATFAVQLTMGEYLEMGGDDGSTTPPIATVVTADPPNTTVVTPTPPQPTVVTPILDDELEEKIDRDTQVSVIFPTAKYVGDLFAGYDDEGARKPKPSGPDLSRYAYLAHVRNVNTKNVANAGLNDDGLYSIVHAHRSGPLNLTTPKPLIVHLVSLEGVEQNLKFPLDPGKRVAFVSLYSWTYLCLPPDEVNFVDSMRHIGFSIQDNKCWLQAPDDVIKGVKGSTKVAKAPTELTDRLAKRMEDGFCLQRYMLHSGEETMAFYRGPLTPCYVRPIEQSWWPFQSNFSTDYQVLDTSLGIMDITYSAAWQLGRTLGIANQAFTAALVRLRTTIQTTGRRGALKHVAPQAVNSKAETLASIRGSVDIVSQLSAAKPGEQPSTPHARHAVSPKNALVFQKSGSDPSEGPVPLNRVLRSLVRNQIMMAASQAGGASVDHLAAATVPSSDDDVFIPFNEINVPNNADWQLVQSWILDNMFLKNIPAHYLIPDPSYLPPETIRFFYIDSNWMDAFIDGALSIGNHLDRTDDVVRQAFKRNLNRYFKSKFHDQQGHELNYHPQIPSFGFFLRSAVVKAFPDLQIHAPWTSADNLEGAREPTLRFETIEKDTLLCLFDRMPGSTHWDEKDQITLSQPPHQQCFRIGTEGGLTSEKLEVEFPAVYTTLETPLKEGRFDPLRIVKWTKGSADGPVEAAENSAEKDAPITDIKLSKAVFDWDSRMIVFPAFSDASHAILTQDMARPLEGTAGSKKYFDDEVPTSAVVGTVLTSHVAKLKIELPRTTKTDTDNIPPNPAHVPRHIRLPDDKSDNPDDWVIVPHPDDNNQRPPTPDPSNPPQPPHTSPAAPPPGKPTGLPGSFNPEANPPIPANEITHLTPTQRVLNKQLGLQFKLIIFPLGQTPTPTTPIPPVKVPLPKPGTAADHPIDLVIGLVLQPSHNTLHNLQLFSIQLKIPMGTKATDLVMSPYQGSGGRMLRNARFNAHCSFDAKTASQEYLVFTLIPRATGRLVPLRNTPEVSFVVNQARLNGVKGLANVLVQENYRRQDGGDYFVHYATGGVVLEKVTS